MEIVMAMENQAAGWQYFINHSTAHGIHKTSLLPCVCCFEEDAQTFPRLLLGEWWERHRRGGC